MKQRVTIIKGICFLTFCVCVVTAAPALGGLGVSPSAIELTNVLKGSTRQRGVIIYNTFDSEEEFAVYAVGEAKKWIRFYDSAHLKVPIKKVKISANKSKTVAATIKVPKDAANGVYRSKIYAQKGALKRESKRSGVGTALKIPCLVSIGVTGDQILEGEVSSITLRDIEIGYPLKMMIEFVNKGNVTARPEIQVEISQAGITVDKFVYAKTKVPVEYREVIPVKWSTKGRGLGTYIAKIAVSLDKKELVTRNLPFKILELGTLTRKGFLQSLTYSGDPEIGKTTKVLAEFRNNGEIATYAKFIGEVYKDGSLLNKIESEKTLVPVEESRNLECYLQIPEKGNYQIVGYVSFEGKKSNTKKLNFRLGYSLWLLILFFTIILLIAAAASWFIIKRRRSYRPRHT